MTSSVTCLVVALVFGWMRWSRVDADLRRRFAANADLEKEIGDCRFATVGVWFSHLLTQNCAKL